MKKLLPILFLLFAAIPASAAEEGETLSPFAGNVGNALWTLIIFVIVVVILGKFAWGPVLSLLKEREEFIHKSLADAKRDRDEAEARLKDYAAKLQSSQAEASAIVERAHQDAGRLRDDLRERAKSEADAMIKKAQVEIESQTAQAVRQIRQEAVEMSVTIASKLLQRNVTKEDNDKLIADALKEIESASKTN
jgi:F-type H+-transporting ATPase subunit b